MKDLKNKLSVNKFKLIVAGSRDFNDYNLLCKTLDKILANVNEQIEIVSGTCGGADKLGEKYGEAHGYLIKRMPANWKPDGKTLDRSAGYKRNRAMAKYAAPDGGCVVFRVNMSAGSTHMIDLAREYKVKLRIIDINI